MVRMDVDWSYLLRNPVCAKEIALSYSKSLSTVTVKRYIEGNNGSLGGQSFFSRETLFLPCDDENPYEFMVEASQLLRHNKRTEFSVERSLLAEVPVRCTPEKNRGDSSGSAANNNHTATILLLLHLYIYSS